MHRHTIRVTSRIGRRVAFGTQRRSTEPLVASVSHSVPLGVGTAAAFGTVALVKSRATDDQIAVTAAQIVVADNQIGIADEPLFTYADFKKMVAEEERIVVAYQGALYDVSDFTGHPGGVGRLQMAAGGDLEVYWSIYTQHNRGHVAE